MSRHPTLNELAMQVADAIEAGAHDLRVSVARVADARVIDCGAGAPGGLRAGVELARACMAGLGEVSLCPASLPGLPGPAVQVHSDDPVRTCLASQYAGWQIQVGRYFAMGSGPMRAAHGSEPLLEHIRGKEEPPVAVGVLETRKPPDETVIAYLRERLPRKVGKLTLLYAPASSIAGTVQVVARSLETALHKLHELRFDLTKVISGYGVAPLPPVAADEKRAVGRTNDAILYGGRVTLWVRADDDELAELGPKVPSAASAEHGTPFAEILERAGDFYQIDPLLFSPAEVTFQNLKTGRCHVFGRVEPEILARSFGL